MRSFSCSKEDLDKFTTRVKELCKTQTMLSLIEEFRTNNQFVFDIYSLKADETTLSWYEQAVKTEDPVALHYYIHHALWQIVDSNPSADDPFFNLIRDITSDCLTR